MFWFLRTNGNDPKVDEISENQVNAPARQVNIPGILWGDARGNKNLTEECSIVIDTGFIG